MKTDETARIWARIIFVWILFLVCVFTVQPDALKMYREADLDGDNDLSMEELSVFQKNLYKAYKYLPNKTALSPDEFLLQGGGDCEDWAIMICGLLSYYDYENYVGVLPGSDPGVNHAIALVAAAVIYPGEVAFRLKDYYLICLDYDLTGGVSSAVGSLERLQIFPADLLIGQEM